MTSSTLEVIPSSLNVGMVPIAAKSILPIDRIWASIVALVLGSIVVPLFALVYFRVVTMRCAQKVPIWWIVGFSMRMIRPVAKFKLFGSLNFALVLLNGGSYFPLRLFLKGAITRFEEIGKIC